MPYILIGKPQLKEMEHGILSIIKLDVVPGSLSFLTIYALQK